MVLPQNIGMCRSLLDIGLTTISSVWNTPSTTMPNIWLPTWVTTMKPFSTSLAGTVLDLEQRLEMNERQELLAKTKHGGVLDALDAMFGILSRAHQFDHGELRNREAVARALHDQRRNDCQRERDLDHEARALPKHGLHVDGAADLVDVGADHVHADAAAGNARHLAGRGEARHEDELLDLRVRHLVDLGLGREPAGDRVALMRSVSSPRPSSDTSMMM